MQTFFFHLPTLFSVQLGERDGIKIESAPIKLLFASCKYGNWIIFSTATLFYNLILCFKMKKMGGGWKFFEALHKTSSKEIVVQMVLVISPTSLDGVFIVWKKNTTWLYVQDRTFIFEVLTKIMSHGSFHSTMDLSTRLLSNFFYRVSHPISNLLHNFKPLPEHLSLNNWIEKSLETG